MNKVKNLALTLALVAAVGMVSSSCFVSTSGEPVVSTGYYTPQYYNGYVVYYDTLGRPMYYTGGVRYYVPATYMHYNSYVSHYRTHRVHYNRWNRSRGHRYRTYRRNVRRNRRTTRRTNRRVHRRKAVRRRR